MTSGIQISQVPPALVRIGRRAVATLTRPALVVIGLLTAGSGSVALAADLNQAAAVIVSPTAHGDTVALAKRTTERPVLSIELHPTWCQISGTVSSSALAVDLIFALGDAFPQRCLSHDLDIFEATSVVRPESSSPAHSIDLPLNLDQLPDLLRELAASTRPVRIDWFPDSHRLVVRGHAYSRVTVAALAMRLRMASSPATADGIIFENRIEVIAPPRSLAKSSLALATVIEREYENIELPMLPPVELQPIYFTHRDSSVDRQEMPKLIDALDQISTAHPNGNWPKLMVTGYALPRGDQIVEIADGLRRASSVRDNLVALGIPEDRITVQSVAGNEATGLTWRSRRVEISVDTNQLNNSKLVTTH